MIIDPGLQGKERLKYQVVIRDPVGALNRRKFPPIQALCSFGMDVKHLFPVCRLQCIRVCQAISHCLWQIDFKYRLVWHGGPLGQAN